MFVFILWISNPDDWLYSSRLTFLENGTIPISQRKPSIVPTPEPKLRREACGWECSD